MEWEKGEEGVVKLDGIVQLKVKEVHENALTCHDTTTLNTDEFCCLVC
jgi:hypothetical protein